jgi:hypothetical protein
MMKRRKFRKDALLARVPSRNATQQQGCWRPLIAPQLAAPTSHWPLLWKFWASQTHATAIFQKPIWICERRSKSFERR